MNSIELSVNQDCKERMDKYLAENIENMTRSKIQLLFKNNQVSCNGFACKASDKVNRNDVIHVQIQESTCLDTQPEKMDLEIRYEDNDVIVINKPKGMVVHPAHGNNSHTLVNGLLYYCKDLSGINGIKRPGIVHRIDKDTSGLLIVAKNDKAHLSLSEQLQEKTVQRYYYALVHGVIEHDHGSIDAPIGRDPKNRKRMCVIASNSKVARTHFKVLHRYCEYTLIECQLETGRTHQIRVHMQYIKHPIVGDETYGYRKTLKTQGQLLHAFRLCFIQPTTQQEMCVEAPLPQAFQNILDAL